MKLQPPSKWAVQTAKRFRRAQLSEANTPLVEILGEIDDVARLLPDIVAHRVRATAFVNLAVVSRAFDSVRAFEMSEVRIIASMSKLTGSRRRYSLENRDACALPDPRRSDQTYRLHHHEKALLLLSEAWARWRRCTSLGDYRDEVLQMIPESARPSRRVREAYCEQDWFELQGGIGRLVHLRDGSLSRCFYTSSPPGDLKPCGYQYSIPPGNDTFHTHHIGFTDIRADVTCPECISYMKKDQCAADKFLAGLRAQPNPIQESQYIFENMGEFSLRKNLHYVTRLGSGTIDLIIDGYLSTSPRMSTGIGILVATKPHGDIHSRRRLLDALKAQLPEPTLDEPKGTALVRTVLNGFP